MGHAHNSPYGLCCVVVIDEEEEEDDTPFVSSPVDRARTKVFLEWLRLLESRRFIILNFWKLFFCISERSFTTSMNIIVNLFGTSDIFVLHHWNLFFT
jgi:hypothetical protein